MIKQIGYQTGIILHDILRVPNILIDVADDALKNFSSKKMDTYFDKVDKMAMLDSKYKDIENKRKIEGSENTILFDEEIGLDYEAMNYQLELRSSLLPEPFLMPFYRYLNNSPIHVTKNRIKYAFQRLTRGWDDSSTWSLDYYLCKTLGAQLKHLAKTTHGWPQGEDFPEFEDWQKTLNHHGDVLLKYAAKDDILFKEENSYDKALEEKIIKDAQKSLRWVAKYLPNLWD